MKRLLFVAAVVLVATPAAQAKGPIQVCGAGGCAELAPETASPMPWLNVAPDAQWLTTVRPAPYFVVSWGHGPLAVWVPAARALRVSDEWIAPDDSQLALLNEKSQGLVPFSPPRHAVAYVDWQRVRNGDGYLKLVTVGTPVAAAPSGTRWVDLRVMGGASPWNDGSISLSISRNGYLLRDDHVFRVSTALARRVLARLPL